MSVSRIRRADGKPGGLVEILSDLGDFISDALPDGVKACIEAVQHEIVIRAPIRTGQMRGAFASPDAIKQTGDNSWEFGLLTKQLQKRAYYWTWVEYGTKGSPAQIRGTMSKSGRRIRKTRAARRARSPHPFVRPGVLAAREKFKDITINLTGKALEAWKKGK